MHQRRERGTLSYGRLLWVPTRAKLESRFVHSFSLVSISVYQASARSARSTGLDLAIFCQEWTIWSILFTGYPCLPTPCSTVFARYAVAKGYKEAPLIPQLQHLRRVPPVTESEPLLGPASGTSQDALVQWHAARAWYWASIPTRKWGFPSWFRSFGSRAGSGRLFGASLCLPCRRSVCLVCLLCGACCVAPCGPAARVACCRRCSPVSVGLVCSALLGFVLRPALRALPSFWVSRFGFFPLVFGITQHDLKLGY